MLASSNAGWIFCSRFRDKATLKQFNSLRTVSSSGGLPELPECRASYIIRHSDMGIGAIQSARVGKRGAIIVPAKLRKRFGIEEGSIVIAEETDDGILIRPAMVVPVERYKP